MSSISKPPNTLTIPKLSPPSHHAPKQPLPSLADPSQSQRHSSHLQPSQPIPTPQSRSSLRPHPIKTPNCSTAQLESYVIIPEVGPPNHQSLPPHEHRVLSQSPPATPRDFVTLFLLENNRLLSASVHQLKWEEQVNKGYLHTSFTISPFLLLSLSLLPPLPLLSFPPPPPSFPLLVLPPPFLSSPSLPPTLPLPSTLPLPPSLHVHLPPSFPLTHTCLHKKRSCYPSRYPQFQALYVYYFIGEFGCNS